MPKSDSKTIQTLGPSRQVAALAGKAVSFQKRQLFTNICCIGLCPLIMVVMAASLGTFVSNLITRNSLSREFVFCSNKLVMNEINLPVWGFGDPRLVTTGPAGIPGAKEDTVYHTNFANVAGKINLRTGPGATAGLFKRPCVTWYGEDYPKSAVYEQDPKATGFSVRDSSFLAQPLGGWFNAILGALKSPPNGTSVDNMTVPAFDFNSLNVFLNYQLKSASIYALGEGVDESKVGRKEIQDPISLGDFARLTGAAPPSGAPINRSARQGPSESGPTRPQQSNQTLFKRQARNGGPPTPAFAPANGTGGLFGTIPTRYFADFKTGKSPKFNGFLPTPYYNKTTGSDDDLDDRITEKLQDVISRIAKLDKDGILSSDPETRSEAALRIQDELSTLPHGAIYFNRIDHDNLKYSWNYHYGSDRRVVAASSFPPEGQRLLFQQTQLDNAILRNSNTSRFGSAQITQGLRILPEVQNTKLQLPFGGLIGDILYPFGVSFLLPIFCVILVQEKEYRILVMMRMNGMKTWAYYLSHYVTFFTLFAVSSTVFLASGVFSGLTLFTRTDPLLLAFLFAVWGNVQIAMAFSLSTIFNKGRIALVISFLLVLCSVIVALVIGQLFVDDRAPSALFIWPPFAFYRVLNLLNFATLDVSLRPYAFADLFGDNEVSTCTWFMFVEIPAFFFLAFYFDAIFPSEFGVKRPWHFPITAWLNKKDKKSTQGTLATDAVETRFEDQDVRDERKRVCSDTFNDAEYPLVMKNMRKVYAGRGGAGPKLAVKDVTFAVEKGITFGLLGPNGAGKSTLISILTGLYPASSGVAILNQFDISTNIADVYKCIGICPQFDILWNELTISEHLYFYARLKGIRSSDEDAVVKVALEQVSLLSFKNRLVKGLSGGEKRRLSIAIALLGDPAVVFLDEPTTGLDPEVRRLIWNIVNESRKDRTVILTTHSMEEAEALCQRIGIMARGTLRCIADQLRLKELYGTGFKLFANCDSNTTGEVARYLESILPNGWTRIDYYETTISYEFPAVKGAISKLFMEIEANRDKVGILDWGLGQTTLEEVFVRLISEADAAAEY